MIRFFKDHLGKGALLLLLANSAACLPSAQHPKLQVQGAQFIGVEATLKPVQLLLRLDLEMQAENPNSFDLQIRNVRGSIVLAEHHTLPMDMHPNLWLPAGAVTPFVVPVSIPVPMALSLLKTSLTHDCIPYRIDGEVDLTASSSFKLERDHDPLRKDACIPRSSLLDAAAKLGH
jgi:hypothetical protein